MSRAAVIEIGDANHHHAGCVKLKDAAGRRCFRALDAGAQAMLLEELREDHGHSFIKRTASGHAQDNPIGLLLWCQVLRLENGQVSTSLIKPFERRHCLHIARWL